MGEIFSDLLELLPRFPTVNYCNIELEYRISKITIRFKMYTVRNSYFRNLKKYCQVTQKYNVETISSFLDILVPLTEKKKIAFLLLQCAFFFLLILKYIQKS